MSPWSCFGNRVHRHINVIVYSAYYLSPFIHFFLSVSNFYSPAHNDLLQCKPGVPAAPRSTYRNLHEPLHRSEALHKCAILVDVPFESELGERHFRFGIQCLTPQKYSLFLIIWHAVTFQPNDKAFHPLSQSHLVAVIAALIAASLAPFNTNLVSAWPTADIPL